MEEWPTHAGKDNNKKKEQSKAKIDEGFTWKKISFTLNCQYRRDISCDFIP